MKLKEIVYMVLDELKGISDDFSFNEEHIIFLADKYRAFLLKQRYSDIKKEIPTENYQEICIDLEQYTPNEICGETYLRSIEKIPSTMTIGNKEIYAKDFYKSIYISYVSKERMMYVGNNKFLQNIIYCSFHPDNHIVLKSNNAQFRYLKQVKMSAIFNDASEAAKMSCDNSSDESCDILDKDFPLESALVTPLIELIVKELTAAEYKVTDVENNAKDDLGDLASQVRLNTKTPLQKQMGL